MLFDISAPKHTLQSLFFFIKETKSPQNKHLKNIF